MKICACMKREVISLSIRDNLERAAQAFVQNHIGTLPVVDDQLKLVGLIQLQDLLALVMPDFVRLLEDFEFVRDFGAVENRLPTSEQMRQPVTAIMQPPIFVDEESGLLRAFSILNRHKLADLPVVNKEGVLVGIASRVDIGTALLRGWGRSGGGSVA